jgi:hypothetical protein
MASRVESPPIGAFVCSAPSLRQGKPSPLASGSRTMPAVAVTGDDSETPPRHHQRGI